MRSPQQTRQTGEYRGSARRKAPIAPHVFMALYGAGWALAFEAGVRIYVAELVSVAGLLLVGWWGALQRYPAARSILGAYGLWVLAIVVSDIVNETALRDSMRALATPVIGGAGFVFVVAVLHRDIRAILTFLAAVAIAKGILGEPLYGEAFAELGLGWEGVAQDTNYFKVRFVPFLTPAFALIACLFARVSLLLAALFLVFVSVGYFALDARSAGLVFFAAALGLFAVHFQFRPRPGQLLIAGLVGAVIGYGAYTGYVTYSLSADPNGHNARQLARMKNPYDPFELLLQGRSEWTVAADAISEKPIFGHGSWAQDIGNKYSWLRLERSGIDWALMVQQDYWKFIPVHSVLVSMLLWPGILGLPAVLMLLRSLISGALGLFQVKSPLLPMAFIFCASALWDFIFSPPQSVRVYFPFELGLLIVLVSQAVSVPRSSAQFAGRAAVRQF